MPYPAVRPVRYAATVFAHKSEIFEEREKQMIESIRNMWRWRSLSTHHNNSVLRAYIRQDLDALRSIRSARAAYFEGTNHAR